MPTINYYWLNHPELFQREFTSGELVTIAITAVIIATITISLIFYLTKDL